MKKSISVNKTVGRPKKKGGVHPVSAVRLPPEISAAVDGWALKQSDRPGRSEAIRRLVEPSKPAGKTGRKSRAAELAANAIEKMIDPSATLEERAQRRRRLTKGPPEFLEH